MSKTKIEIVLSGEPAVKKRLEVLNCDFDSFWKDEIVSSYENTNDPHNLYSSFLGNMLLSVNYHLKVLKGQLKTFEHPGGRGNVPVVYECSFDDFGGFVERAWNLIAARIREKDPDGKLTHLETL